MNESRCFQASPHALTLIVALALAACAMPSSDPEIAARTVHDAPRPTAADPIPDESAPVERLISLQSPEIKAYRKIGAGHIYKHYPKRIYKGKIPALVYAVVVVETGLDAHGNVTDVSFSRTPGHAAEVASEIAALIRAASPLPSPGKLGAHTYIDVWLWDKSGNFQLGTLTQGQRSR